MEILSTGIHISYSHKAYKSMKLTDSKPQLHKGRPCPLAFLGKRNLEETVLLTSVNPKSTRLPLCVEATPNPSCGFRDPGPWPSQPQSPSKQFLQFLDHVLFLP